MSYLLPHSAILSSLLAPFWQSLSHHGLRVVSSSRLRRTVHPLSSSSRERSSLLLTHSVYIFDLNSLSLGHVPIIQPVALHKRMGCSGWPGRAHISSSEARDDGLLALPNHMDLDCMGRGGSTEKLEHCYQKQGKGWVAGKPANDRHSWHLKCSGMPFHQPGPLFLNAK